MKMTDRPILFSAPMIRALLDGNKTQTRRNLALRGFSSFTEFGPSTSEGYDWHFRNAEMCWNDITHSELLAMLRFQIGNHLWVKETWQISGAGWEQSPPVKDIGKLHYRATDEGQWKPYWGGWRSPLHMFRWASRLTLKVTDVRVERLNDISEADALAEGIVPAMEGFALTKNGECWGPNAKGSFSALWDSINGESEGAGWYDNPWVVAVSFIVERRNIDQ